MRRIHCAVWRKPHGRVCRCPPEAEGGPQLIASKKPETTRKPSLPTTGVSLEIDFPPDAPDED